MTWEELTGERAVTLDRVYLYLVLTANFADDEMVEDALRHAADEILNGTFEVVLAKYDD